MGALTAQQAKEKILSGDGARGIVVDDCLDLSSVDGLTRLPAGLTCYELDASNTQLTKLPDSLRVECSLVLRDCPQLAALPPHLTVGTLDVSGCVSLCELPPHLDVWFLLVAGCTALSELPESTMVRNGGINVSGCAQLSKLPASLGPLATLDISDCPGIVELPAGLVVGQWVDVAGSGVREMQPQIAGCTLRWRGVVVDERIAFRPETITTKEILREDNAELRRVKIERFGFEEFMRDAGAKVIDRDSDPGGARELLRLPLKDDEDIICLSCFCPSTERHYLLRVPPEIKGCHQAAAWMAGFDDPSEYEPVIET
ncbi:MAG: hypothetical protein QGG36_18180 [Pirellulaceae bacterium]|nr:hypothetical protein [Pirellulaceae bacterium]